MGCTKISVRLAGELKRLAFLREHAGSLLAWSVVCVTVACLLWGLTLSKLRSDKAELESDAVKYAASLTKAYAEQLERSVEQIDQVTLNLKYYWNKTAGAVKLEKQLQQGLYPASSHLYLTIVDRHGTPVTSTLPLTANSAGIADQPYFQAHKNASADGLLITGRHAGQRLGTPVVLFSRRLEAADGSFDGIVIVAVEPGYLSSFTDEASLARGDFLAVMANDGLLLAAKTGEGMRALSSVFRSPPDFGADQGVAAMEPQKFADGQARIVAWKKVAGYPLVATVGLSEQEIAAAYQAKARDYLLMAVAASLFLVAAAIIGGALSARLAWRKRQADEVKNAYRLATDGAREGFYMMRALYDDHGQVVDFLFEDCNERGGAYYGKTRSQLIGSKFTDVYAGTANSQYILGKYCQAMTSGFVEDEIKVWPQSPLQVKWVQRRLVRSGDGLAVTLRDISEMKAHEEALSRLANADAVTALPNRHWLIHYLPGALALADAGRTMLALLFVDLDDFKNINDTLGHAAGDELLQAVAQRLQAALRPQDHVVRLGGDEFTIILEHADSREAVARVAERLMASLQQPFVLSGGSSHLVRASVGISLFPHDGADGPTLLKHADIAMYAAKADGKGHYQFYQPQLSANLVGRLDREHALRHAIERGQFVLYYQPRVDAFSGELRGMEALVRWRHPERGLVGPEEFIAMAEDTGLIVALGEMVIGKACAQLAQWQAQGLPLAPVSINVSARQFSHGNLAARFAAGLARHGLAPQWIEIEITESCMMAEDQTVTAELAALEALGIKLLVDDFGTGYSSLSQLQRLDLEVLKVDRAFTAQLCHGKEGEALFMAILSMAHVLGMRVVAEGVETLEQLRVLQALSCNEVQGYFISPPVTAGEMPALMRKRFLFPADDQLKLPI